MTLVAKYSYATQWLLKGAGVLVITWLVGAGWLLHQTEVRLTQSAVAMLATKGGEFAKIGVSFRGQTAMLQANGASPRAVEEASKLIRDELRLDHGLVANFNPVAAVVRSDVTNSMSESALESTTSGQRRSYWANQGPSIPPGWVLLCASPGRVALRGVLSTESEKARLLEAVRNKWAVESPDGQLEVSAGLAPVTDLDKFCRELGRLPSVAGSHIILSALSTGEWMHLPSNADDLAFALALHGADLTLGQIESLSGMWNQVKPEFTKPMPVSRLVLAAAARVGGEDGFQSSAHESSAMAQPTQPTAPKALPKARLIGPPYIGWAMSKDEVLLTGAVLTESQKVGLVEAADRLFGGRIIKSHLVEVDESRQTPPGKPLELPKQISSSPIALCVAGSGVHSFPADVMDREIVMSIPGLGVTKDQVSGWLSEYRQGRIARGEIKGDEPYMAVVVTDRSILVSGTVGSGSARQSLLHKLTPIASGRQLVDRLMVSPSVADDPSLIVVLQRVPPVARGDSMVFCLRPGQIARRGILHSVYISEETGRSQDYDRATAQLRELMQWIPDAQIEVVGHTDSSGSLAVNDRKGYERAKLCADSLERDLLLAPGTIPVRSAGPREPIAENATPEGRAINRRVDVVVTRLHE